MNWTKAIIPLALMVIGLTIVSARPQQSNTPSERLFDLSSLFNRYPSYQRPGFYGGSGFYQGGFYPNTGYNSQGGFGGYPQSGYGGNGLGTNVLGYGGGSSFGGGYGGYGGFGGNGGLQSYNGYNSNNYNGQRNLGFGYYRGSDQYGFTPSRELNYVSGTGYRGYN